MKIKRILQIIFIAAVVAASPVLSENIDPYDDGSQYGYGENVGWLNFEPNTGDGVQVGSDKLVGWVWAENIGWVSLSCENTSSCGTVDYGVTNDGNGNLSGYAWAENVGWISFSCDNTSSCGAVDYGVTIDGDGAFDGNAWAENIGWISLDSAEGWDVRACIVTMDDLANFASYWLGTDAAANLDATGTVDMIDYSIFASYWQDYCPNGWLLK